ncbi:ABC transporter permease [Cryobacterium psychrophilum]|uniref:ABC transporter permease n=1 Tax=Cryobacterium psychrophilum TaxID=41988 RepID=UPI0010CF0CAA|nr:ABC transporter permease [Cryobacterium psychrophilum]TDW26923.1 osmoprotectant transport system permease protein [Cryobacterium psychrophilum]
MNQFDLSGLLTFWVQRWDQILGLALGHLAVVVVSLLIAVVIGVGIGMLVWNRPVPYSLVIGAAGIALTIPSLALLAVLVPVFGLGWAPTLIALVLYSLLPIVRNTAVGLRAVPPAIKESAKGMGMSPTRVLISVQLPMAWPIIVTGIRVSAQFVIGTAAIAAYVAGPGLGQLIFKGLSSLGSKNALNLALTGTLGVIVLALVVDAVLVSISRSTTSRGLRA